MRAAERHWVMEFVRLNQPLYYKSVLTLKWKSKDVLLWGRSYTFVFIENERLWIHPGLKIRFVGGRQPEYLPVNI